MQAHPTIAFLLDIADKLIKLAAVLLGGIWTYWNYRKSRTYAEKLELHLTGTVFFRGELYVDVIGTLQNTGAARHILPLDSSFCTLYAVTSDLSEMPLHIFPIFVQKSQLEPGELINDALFWTIKPSAADIVWLKVTLRVVSRDIEWNTVSILRVDQASLAMIKNDQRRQG